jgi:hypothetical protein
MSIRTGELAIPELATKGKPPCALNGYWCASHIFPTLLAGVMERGHSCPPLRAGQLQNPPADKNVRTPEKCEMRTGYCLAGFL